MSIHSNGVTAVKMKFSRLVQLVVQKVQVMGIDVTGCWYIGNSGTSMVKVETLGIENKMFSFSTFQFPQISRASHDTRCAMP